MADIRKGSVYRINHKRKGEFVAQVIGFEEGDDADPQIIVVKYDVRVGTSQANLNVGGKDKVRVSGLRPSLILSMEKTQEQKWLRQIEIEYEEKPMKLTGTLRKLFGGK